MTYKKNMILIHQQGSSRWKRFILLKGRNGRILETYLYSPIIKSHDWITLEETNLKYILYTDIFT